MAIKPKCWLHAAIIINAWSSFTSYSELIEVNLVLIKADIEEYQHNRFDCPHYLLIDALSQYLSPPKIGAINSTTLHSA